MDSVSKNVFIYFFPSSQTTHSFSMFSRYCPMSVYGGIKRSLNCPLTLFASKQLKVLWNLLIFQFANLAMARLVTGHWTNDDLLEFHLALILKQHKIQDSSTIFTQTMNTKLFIESIDNWQPHAVTVYRHFKVATEKKVTKNHCNCVAVRSPSSVSILLKHWLTGVLDKLQLYIVRRTINEWIEPFK